jgi:TP901 family phage tail tape measure protein
MPATTETLIFELKVKDDASKVFDAWEKRLGDLEKIAKNINFKNVSKGFDEIKKAANDPTIQEFFTKTSTAAKAFIKTLKEPEKIIKALAAEAGQATGKMIVSFRKVGDFFKGGWKDLKLPITAIKEQVKKMSSIVIDGFKRMISKAGDLLKSGLKAAFSGLVSLATSAFSKVVDIGIRSFKEVASAVGNFVKDSITAYMSFEDQLALVGKTTGLVGEELKKLGDVLRQDAKAIGALTAEDLLKVAEVAGQLGIEGTENIRKFSNEIGIGSVALDKFGGDTEKLALSIAKQQSVFDLTVDSTANMLSMLSKLSTSTKANEVEISKFNLGMGRVAQLMGITAQESSAMGAVLISTGLEAGSAARLLSSSFTDLSAKSKSLAATVKLMNIDMNTGGQAIQQLEQITGRSAESFGSLGNLIQAAFSTDATASIMAISGAVAHMEQSGTKVGIMYDAVGKQGMAVLNALGLATQKNSADIQSWSFAMNTANQSFASGTEHMSAYERQMEKTSAKIDLFKSVLNSIMLIIGEPFVEAIGRLMEKANKFINAISVWVEESTVFKQVLEDIVGFLESIGDFALDFLIAQFKELVEYLETNGVSAWDTIHQKILSAWETAKQFIIDLIEGLKNIDADKVAAQFRDVMEAIKSAWEIAKFLVSIIRSIKEAAGDMKIAEHFKHAKDIIGGVADILKGDVLDGLNRIATAIKDEIILNVKTLGETFKNVFRGLEKMAADIMDKIASAIHEKIGGAINAVGKMIAGLWNKIKSIGGAAEKAAGDAEKAAGAAKKAADAAKNMDSTTKKTGDESAKAMEKAADAAKDVGDAIDDANSKQKEFAEEGYEHSVWPDTEKWVDRAANAVNGLDSNLNSAAAAMKRMGDIGIQGTANNIQKAIESTRSLIPSSPQVGGRAVNKITPALTGVAPIQGQTEMPSIARIGGTGSPSGDTGRRLSHTPRTRGTPTIVNQNTNVTFSGMNIVDESSKNRFARTITKAQNNIKTLAVRA